jgi:hypothetical protein
MSAAVSVGDGRPICTETPCRRLKVYPPASSKRRRGEDPLDERFCLSGSGAFSPARGSRWRPGQTPLRRKPNPDNSCIDPDSSFTAPDVWGAFQVRRRVDEDVFDLIGSI